jgi:hypothetical protein
LSLAQRSILPLWSGHSEGSEATLLSLVVLFALCAECGMLFEPPSSTVAVLSL